MSQEDKEILDRISKLAGQINLRKTSLQAQQQSNPIAQPSHHRYSPYGGVPNRGFRAARSTAPYRHRSLVLNGGQQQQHGGRLSGIRGSRAAADAGPSMSGLSQPQPQPQPSLSSSSSSSLPSWVSKTDRHRQLINSAVYERESQARTKAMEETRQCQLRARSEREQAKLARFLASRGTYRAAAHASVSAHSKPTQGPYEIEVAGLMFRVAKDGSKLIKSLDGIGHAIPTPKMAVVGGVKFYRSKNGNLYRAGVLRAHRSLGGVRKLKEACKVFSSSGSCPKGPNCRYQHDPSRVAICKEYLIKSTCSHGDNCDLSHEVTPERTPLCLHYAKGNCTNAQCMFSHSTASAGGLVCRAFGLYGYCDKGSECSERHVSECPDFSNSGKCKRKGCKLPHRERASVLRKVKQRRTSTDEEADIIDATSDDESVDSDDVDSEEVETYLGADDDDDNAFGDQREFIAF